MGSHRYCYNQTQPNITEVTIRLRRAIGPKTSNRAKWFDTGQEFNIASGCASLPPIPLSPVSGAHTLFEATKKDGVVSLESCIIGSSYMELNLVLRPSMPCILMTVSGYLRILRFDILIHYLWSMSMTFQ